MLMTLGELAELVGGRVIGDPLLEIERPATLADAGDNEITFIDHSDRVGRLRDSNAAAAVIPEFLATELETNPQGSALIVADDPHQAFAQIVSHFRPPRVLRRLGISSQANLSDSVTLGEDVDVHAGATIGDDVVIGAGSTIHGGVRILPGCRLGENVTLMPGVVLYDNTVIGDRTVVHAKAVIGAYGFGYQFSEGRHLPTAQLGNVEIGKDVEIGANTTIDRGTYDATTIGDGTKIDNLVMIAHNCRIGRHNMICSQVGIAGSSTTGDYVVLAGQVGIRDHVHIGTGAVVGAMAGVSNDIPDGARYFGAPATPERQQKLKQAAWSKLPEMRREFKKLQREVADLKNQLSHDCEKPDDQAAA